jgi:hypothetical protein
VPRTPSHRTRVEAPRLATAAVVLVAAVICYALNFPGHLSYDSVVQLSEGRTGVYSGEHPPVMSWLLGLADAVSPGAALFVAFDVAMIYGALLALVWLGRPKLWVAVVAALLALLPQLSVYPAIVWKDVLFGGSLIAGYTCLAWAAARWSAPLRRWTWLAASMVFLVLAALARQNGAVALPIAALAVGWIAARSWRGTWRAAAFGVGFLAVTGALFVVGAAALSTRLQGPDASAEAWQALELSDIVAATVRDPRLDLPVLHAQAPGLEAEVRTSGARAYSPARVDTLEPAFTELGDGDDSREAVIAAQWRDLVVRHPLLYLRVRLTAFRWVLTTPRPDACGLVETGVDGPPYEMSLSGLKPRQTPRDNAIGDYALAFAGTPAFSHVAFGGVSLAVLVWLLRPRRRPADIAVAGMIVSALAFAASFALISIACDYRYLYALDLAAIAAALYLASSLDRDGVRRNRLTPES